MKGRNPNVGRHSIGAPIAKSGVKPPKRTGAQGLKGPGARTYSKNMPITSATLMQSGSGSSNANDYTAQGEQFVKQSPEPFRNSQPSSMPTVPKTKDSGTNNAYTGYKGNRISESIPRSAPQRNTPGVGISGAKNSGMGSNNNLVVAGQGAAKTRRAGPFVNVPSAKKRPSFYGR